MIDPYSVSLEEARRQARLEEGYDDDKLQECLDSAVSAASDFLDRDIPWEDDDGNRVKIPGSVRAAILCITRDLYDERGATGELLQRGTTAYNLLFPHKILGA